MLKDKSVEYSKEKNSKLMALYTLFLSLAFSVAIPFACIYTKDYNFIDGFLKIILSPSNLVTDYFALGGLAATFFNAALCGFASNLLILISRVRANSTTLASYMLVVAHCFYGLNFLNMWPSIIGVLLYCLVMKKSFAENLHIALFSTAIGPFVSEILFRYIGGYESIGGVIVRIIFVLILGIITGFVIPALIPETTKMHRGYNMYKAGLAIGLLGIFINSFLFPTFGFSEPDPIEIINPEYYALTYSYRGFVNIFLILLFTITLLAGFLFNKRSFKGYGALIKCSGHGTDFFDKFGMPICLINIGIYGLCAVGYLNIIFVLPEIFEFLPSGAGFTGATLGVVFAALTFAADGQQPRTVAPIVIGYALLFFIVFGFCLTLGRDIPFTLSTQGYINGLAFATGLCPFSGKYGAKIGILAGFLSAVICTSTASMHGGFVLYNGGFTAGLTALVLLPILDFYKIKPKFEDDVQ